MARLTFGHPRTTVVGAARAAWSRLRSMALRINGSQMPLVLDKADRGTLQLTLDG